MLDFEEFRKSVYKTCSPAMVVGAMNNSLLEPTFACYREI